MQSTSSDAARLLAALAGWVGVPWEELAPSESESSMGTGASTYTGKFDRIAFNQLVKMLVTGLRLRLWLKLLLSILQLAPELIKKKKRFIFPQYFSGLGILIGHY